MDAVSTPAAVLMVPVSAADRLALLFDTHYDRLYRLARRLSRSADDAPDLVMHELEGVSAAEIATLLGIAVVTVRWHLFRARRELAAAVNVKGRTS